MERPRQNGMKIIKCILGMLMAGSFLFFALGEMFYPPENHLGENTFAVLEAEWVRVLPDGTQEAFEVPGECDVVRGDWVTIRTTLSSTQRNTWLCMRSMQQELRIYVGGELRKEYSTLETQPFGKTSTMTYIFFPLYESDAGQELRIEFMSDSAYAGYVSEIYSGDRYDIVEHFYHLYAPSAVVALLMLVISLFVIFGSVFTRFLFRREEELLYLGNATLVASTWLLVESKLRQFIFPNSTVAMLMGFLMIAVLPYPLMSYINCIQNYRYKKIYTALGAATALNFIWVVGIQVLNIKDFFETMTSSHVIILALIVVIAVTIILDIIEGYVREYREVAIGFAALMLAGVCEIGLTYIVNARLNGIALCFGLGFLLVSAGLKSIRDMFNVQKEKQLAVAESESRAKFLANMSHEIRTPINTVIGMNEMILRENNDATIAEYADNIKSASRMLLSLINDVLDLSKIEAGKLQIVEKEYELASMIRSVATESEVRAKQKDLKFTLEADEGLPSVLKGDEVRIKQILNNLLSNAIKYTEKGSVTLSVKYASAESGFVLELSVTDTGIGIRQDNLEYLFDSFARFELSKNHQIEGSGLGLSITKQLVDRMAGSIEVQSEYGKGSCFTVCIPQRVVDVDPIGKLELKRKENRTEKAVPTTADAPLYIPDASILAVDDTKMNLQVIQGLLKRTGVKLDVAPGGSECLGMTKEKKYDLILMDHMMPPPDGIQSLHMIRKDENNLNRYTPIVVLTANAIEGMKDQYLKEGFDDYLSKPVDVGNLEQVLRKFLL